MIARSEGLTRIYNRFHDPGESSPDIVRLRELHARIDRAVLDAYGWTDLLPVHDFREQRSGRARLTWVEEIRDEILARLLSRNRIVAAEEAEEASAAARDSS